MKPGDLVRHRYTRELHLVTEARKIKGEVRFVHLSTLSPASFLLKRFGANE